eukprot:TRINITY_DN27193_c0_g1_i1.p1 TRINITY_DN27193_c0_g1~~TRINITY_DN27193_c0_g1_i1.p1  ORF type:complete len:1121 (-),score=184.98 TRINITY_DN27193_c0_g1_i1:248-3610(-)
MDRYPLRISVPHSEVAQSTMIGMRHTAYSVELDDCGKKYVRLRRFSNFVWLHSELQKKQLGCALPQLPPKKTVGNLDLAFVEQRRHSLEEYLVALLRLPPVLHDDTLWTFLDADLATVVVPRFLCRSKAAVPCSEALMQLELVAARESNSFRMSCERVLTDLVGFAETESSDLSSLKSIDSGASRRTLQAQLACRLSFCKVVDSLCSQDQPREGLVEAGMFVAMLALLWRVTEDSQIAPMSREVCADVCTATANCLLKLLEKSRGTAFLRYCKHEHDLTYLFRFASAREDSLHLVAASVIWLGLEDDDAVSALVSRHGSSARGLQLLGRLLSSENICARLHAALSIGYILRKDVTLTEDERHHCLQALTQIPAELDAAESSAIERCAVAARTQSRNTRFAEVANSIELASTDQSNAEPVAPAAADPRQQVLPRVPELSKLLRSLCSPQQLPRLVALITNNREGALDEVTTVAIAAIDHFVRQSLEEPSVLVEVSNALIPHLERLAEGESEGWAFEAPVGGRRVDDVRTRTARILVRFAAASDVKYEGDPPVMTAFYRRGKMLEVMSRHSKVMLMDAAFQVKRASEHGQRQSDHVIAGDLESQPSLPQMRLVEFGEYLESLVKERGAVADEVDCSGRALDATRVSLEQRRLKHGILAADISELLSRIAQQAEDELKMQEYRQAVVDAEERCRTAHALAIELRSKAQEAVSAGRESTNSVRDSEARAAAMATRAAGLADICHSAPAKVERLKMRLAQEQKQIASFAERSQQVAIDAERTKRRVMILRDHHREVDAALKSFRDVQQELSSFHTTLNSELILTDEEVARIRAFEHQLQPARPSRLRASVPENLSDVQSTGSSSSVVGTDAEVSPPVWDDGGAEHEFRASPNFRSFSRLLSERHRLWLAESRWLQESLTRAETFGQQLANDRTTIEKDERAALEREDLLRGEIMVFDDPAGHAARHQEAVEELNQAREAARRLAEEAAESEGSRQLAEARLDQGQAEVREAEALAAQAREIASVETDRSMRARADLDARALEIESRMRVFQEEWRAVWTDEFRLSSMQAHVGVSLRSELDSRSRVREEVRRLLAELSTLEQQLDISQHGEWVHEGVNSREATNVA